MNTTVQRELAHNTHHLAARLASLVCPRKRHASFNHCGISIIPQQPHTSLIAEREMRVLTEEKGERCGVYVYIARAVPHGCWLVVLCIGEVVKSAKSRGETLYTANNGLQTRVHCTALKHHTRVTTTWACWCYLELSPVWLGSACGNNPPQGSYEASACAVCHLQTSTTAVVYSVCADAFLESRHCL